LYSSLARKKYLEVMYVDAGGTTVFMDPENARDADELVPSLRVGASLLTSYDPLHSVQVLLCGLYSTLYIVDFALDTSDGGKNVLLDGRWGR
jgi:hypothetical protein